MQIYTIRWQLTLKLTGPIFKYPNLIRRKYRREGPLSIVANLLLSQALNLADILKEKRLRLMHLKVSIINKDCKVNNHSLCPGYRIGLEMNVFCDCLCHNHRISYRSTKSTSAEMLCCTIIFSVNFKLFLT
ncbi:hypothetical protein BH23THE1_BH23THE1_22990 [soil metagenome]